MHQKIQTLQEELAANNISTFRWLSYENYTLKIAGSDDFAYYHEVEITFHALDFVSCATYFSGATLRLATEQDRKELLLLRTRKFGCTPTYTGPENYIGEKIENIIICILIDEDLHPEDCKKYFIVARDFEYNFETVLYYDKKNE